MTKSIKEHPDRERLAKELFAEQNEKGKPWTMDECYVEAEGVLYENQFEERD